MAGAILSPLPCAGQTRIRSAPHDQPEPRRPPSSAYCESRSTSAGLLARRRVRYPVRDPGRLRRSIAASASSSSSSSSLDEPPVEGGLKVLELPCLPFIPAEVLVPGSSKTLHLYEARYLALLDEAAAKAQGLFAHVLLEPVKQAEQREQSVQEFLAETNQERSVSFVASRCCLARVENVRRLEIGALITVRGICRLRLLGLTQTEPFLKGTMSIVGDAVPGADESVEELLRELKATLGDVQQLQIKLKSGGDVPFQTPLEEALLWAERASAPADTNTPPALPDSLRAFVPSRAEIMAFAALQPVTGATAAELHKLLQCRLRAMDTTNTKERLQMSLEYARGCRSSLAAKLAIQDLSV